MWVVGINRPYYPSLEFFENKEDADKAYLELLDEEYAEGQYDIKVFIAKVEFVANIKTEY